MTADQELLVLAAKAAGFVEIDFLSQDHWANVYDAEGRHSAWNPLTNDGDALRLAVELMIGIDVDSFEVEVMYSLRNVHPMADGGRASEYVAIEGDPIASVRRAIVVAAAEIGKSMP